EKSRFAPDKPDEIAHGATNFIPKVSDHDFFAQGARRSEVPGSEFRWRLRLQLQTFANVDTRLMREDEGFKKAVARESIGAMKPREGHFTDNVKSVLFGAPRRIRHNPAAAVVRAGDNGDVVKQRVDAKRSACLDDIGKTFFESFDAPTVEIHM